MPDSVPVRVPPVSASRAVESTALIVMFAEPLNETPLIVRAVSRVVAVEALPESVAVIVPAEKLPPPSL